jgi:hypothetical protein
MICYWSERHMLRLVIVTYKVTAEFILYSNKFMMCYWSEHCMLRLVIVTYKLTAVFILYSTKFMICYWSEHCMVWPSLWFVSGQNTVWYDQVYDLLLVRTLYGMTKFMICYWSEYHMLRLVIVSYKLTAVFILYSTKFMVWLSLWFVTGQNTVCYDQVYDLLLFRTPYEWYVTISKNI